VKDPMRTGTNPKHQTGSCPTGEESGNTFSKEKRAGRVVKTGPFGFRSYKGRRGLGKSTGKNPKDPVGKKVRTGQGTNVKKKRGWVNCQRSLKKPSLLKGSNCKPKKQARGKESGVNETGWRGSPNPVFPASCKGSPKTSRVPKKKEGGPKVGPNPVTQG